MVESLAGQSFDRLLTFAKNTCAGTPLQLADTAFDAKNRAFAYAGDRRIVLFKELIDSLLLRFTHVSRIRIGIKEVWADLERDEAERLEGRRLHDGHVLRRFETRPRDD